MLQQSFSLYRLHGESLDPLFLINCLLMSNFFLAATLITYFIMGLPEILLPLKPFEKSQDEPLNSID
jgi:hypothetical protein